MYIFEALHLPTIATVIFHFNFLTTHLIGSIQTVYYTVAYFFT